MNNTSPIQEHYQLLDPYEFETEETIRQRADEAHKNGKQYFPLFFQIRNHPKFESFVINLKELSYDDSKKNLSFGISLIIFPDHIKESDIDMNELTIFCRSVIMSIINDNQSI